MRKTLFILLLGLLLSPVYFQSNYVVGEASLSDEAALLQLYSDNDGANWSWPYSSGVKVPWSTEHGHCRCVDVNRSKYRFLP